MTTITDAKAEQMRKDLAAHEAAKAAEARAAENARRKAVRDAVTPSATILEAELEPVRAKLAQAALDLPPEEWDLANLIRNVVITSESALARAKRRLEDNADVPEAEPVADPTPLSPTA